MILLILIGLGVILGSFVNALVWRLHEQSKTKAPKQNLSILNGHSMCPHCRHSLAAADLIPVFSWLWLRGKCRYCHKPIVWQYPAVELLTGLLFALSYIYWPLAFNSKGTMLFVFWLAFLVGLVALAVYDIKWLLLPDKIVFFLMSLAALQSLILIVAFDGRIEQAGQIGLSFIIGGGIFYVLFQISNGRWIGGGDVKLGMLLGLILASPSLSFLMIFAASILGSAFSLPLLATKKITKKSRIPFGPFLIAGTIASRLFGAAAIAWYKRLAGY